MATRFWLGTAALALFALAISSTTHPAAPQRPNVLLIVIDTLRYDAVSDQNTPFLASLAKRGVVFTNAYSTHDFTPPSHFAMLTGLPAGLHSNIDQPELAIPHQLGLSGYDSFAVVANELLTPATMPAMRGFKDFRGVQEIDQGTIPFAALTVVDQRLRAFGCRTTNRNRAMTYYSGARILPVALQRMRNAQRPWFGFINVIDPHEPYAPDPDEYAPERALPQGFDGDVMARHLSAELMDPAAIKNPTRRDYVTRKIASVRYPKLVAIDLPQESRDTYHRRYAAKVRELDAVLKQFFTALDSEKRLANTVVIVTSDHGEAFGEDDVITHMFGENAAYEVTHHVPLIVIVPPRFHSVLGTVTRKVSIAGIAPMIYEVAGIDASPLRERFPTSIRSLLPLFATTPARVTKLSFPPIAGQPAAAAAREMEQALNAIGYMH